MVSKRVLRSTRAADAWIRTARHDAAASQRDAAYVGYLLGFQAGERAFKRTMNRQMRAALGKSTTHGDSK